MNKGNDHQLEKLLIVKQILLVSLKNCTENSMENVHTDVRCEGLGKAREMRSKRNV